MDQSHVVAHTIGSQVGTPGLLQALGSRSAPRSRALCALHLVMGIRTGLALLARVEHDTWRTKGHGKSRFPMSPRQLLWAHIKPVRSMGPSLPPFTFRVWNSGREAWTELPLEGPI